MAVASVRSPDFRPEYRPARRRLRGGRRDAPHPAAVLGDVPKSLPVAIS